MTVSDAWPSILRCVQIADGEAHMIVCAVGVNCQWGLILTALEPEDDETPLQQDLGDLATSTSPFLFALSETLRLFLINFLLHSYLI